jgi:hypothetical protein
MGLTIDGVNKVLMEILVALVNMTLTRSMGPALDKLGH